MRHKTWKLALVSLMMFGRQLHACIWDADTMLQERLRSHDLAKAVLGNPPEPPSPASLRQRIQKLEASPRRNDPAWWNDLAGAHLRLGEAKVAAEMLEGVTNQFKDDYGIHANLGTAYHLLKRYADAEREIARDLEINPEAHFGLERYHLALLQYLARDEAYQRAHVYVDEWSFAFQRDGGGHLLYAPGGELLPTDRDHPDIGRLFGLRSHFDADPSNLRGDQVTLFATLIQQAPPAYRFHWDLAADTHFKDGVINMAELNPAEPACFVMLGIFCLRERNFNLAAAAFDRAIKLGSPQAEFLMKKSGALHEYARKSFDYKLPMYLVGLVLLAVIGIYIADKIRGLQRLRKTRIR